MMDCGPRTRKATGEAAAVFVGVTPEGSSGGEFRVDDDLETNRQRPHPQQQQPHEQQQQQQEPSATANSDLPFAARHARHRKRARALLTSRKKHYTIMAMVVADVSVILTDIFVALVSCDLDIHAEWVESVHQAMKIIGLVFSGLFLLELLLSVWAWGIRFFYDWFHCFDALVIVANFVIEVLTHGVLEELASIVIVLRLLRFVKIVDEISLGASERLEGSTSRLEALERENAELKSRLDALHS